MEKIKSSLEKFFTPLTLYLEDLEAIVGTISSEGQANEIEIIVGDYKYNSVQELAEHRKGEKLSSLKIKFIKPYGEIDLCPLWARLYVGDNSHKSSGLFFQLDKSLSSCLKKPAFAYNYLVIWPLIVMSLLSGLFIHEYPWLDVLRFVLGFWIFWAVYIRLKRHSQIVLKNRFNTPNFFKRNFDKIILILFGAVIGAIINFSVCKIPYLDGLIKETTQEKGHE